VVIVETSTRVPSPVQTRKKPRVESVCSWNETIEGHAADIVTCFYCDELILVHRKLEKLESHLLECSEYQKLIQDGKTIGKKYSATNN
jgi:hypothetical protein